MIETIVRNVGHLDGACNAAGLTFTGVPTDEISVEEWDRVHSVNLRGLFFSLKYEAKAMLKHGSGSIVNIASTAAIASIPNGADYCSSKAGVAGVTRGAAHDYARKGVRVNAVLPGGTRTKMLEEAFTLIDGLREAVPQINPMGA